MNEYATMPVEELIEILDQLGPAGPRTECLIELYHRHSRQAEEARKKHTRNLDVEILSAALTSRAPIDRHRRHNALQIIRRALNTDFGGGAGIQFRMSLINLFGRVAEGLHDLRVLLKVMLTDARYQCRLTALEWASTLFLRDDKVLPRLFCAADSSARARAKASKDYEIDIYEMSWSRELIEELKGFLRSPTYRGFNVLFGLAASEKAFIGERFLLLTDLKEMIRSPPVR